MPTFHTEIFAPRPTVTGIEVPPDVIEALGGGKKPAVVVTVGGYTYRSTVGVMGGKFLIPLNADHRRASGLNAADPVDVTLELDAEPREVPLPEEFEAALSADPALQSVFDALSHSRKRALVEPIGQAKTPETRQRRIDKAVEALRS